MEGGNSLLYELETAPWHPLATRQVVQPPVLYHVASVYVENGGEIHERKKVGSLKNLGHTERE